MQHELLGRLQENPVPWGSSEFNFFREVSSVVDTSKHVEKYVQRKQKLVLKFFNQEQILSYNKGLLKNYFIDCLCIQLQHFEEMNKESLEKVVSFQRIGNKDIRQFIVQQYVSESCYFQIQQIRTEDKFCYKCYIEFNAAIHPANFDLIHFITQNKAIKSINILFGEKAQNKLTEQYIRQLPIFRVEDVNLVKINLIIKNIATMVCQDFFFQELFTTAQKMGKHQKIILNNEKIKFGQMENNPSYKQIILNDQDLFVYKKMIETIEKLDAGDIDYHTLGCEKNQEIGLLALKRLSSFRHHIKEFAYLFDIDIMTEASAENKDFVTFIKEFKSFADLLAVKEPHFSILRIVGKSNNNMESSYIGLAVNQEAGILIARMQDGMAPEKQTLLLQNCAYMLQELSSYKDPEDQSLTRNRRFSFDLTLTGEEKNYKTAKQQQTLSKLLQSIYQLSKSHQLQEFCVNHFERNIWQKFIKELKEFCNCGCCLQRWK